MQFPNVSPGGAVNKSELIDAVATAAGLEKKQAEAAIAATVDTIVGAIKGGDKVQILGFGTFNPSARAAGIARNPRTGEAVKTAASKGVRFSAGQGFKTALNAKAAAKKAAPAAKKAPAAKAAPATKKAPVAKAAPAAKKGAPRKR